MALKDAGVGAAIPTKDLAAARKFYEGTLGFEPKHEDPNGVYYEAGRGTVFFVYPSQFAGTNEATAAGFEVKDLEAEVKELQAKGVKFEDYDFPGLKTENGIATMGDEKGAWFKDPDGNILAVSQSEWLK